MKICWLENGDFIGGAELFSSEMLSNIPEEILVDVFFGSHDDAVSDLFRNKKSVSVQTLCMPSLQPIGFQAIKNFWKAVWSLKKKIQDEKYDGIYANTVRTAMIASIAKWFLPKSVKLIYFAHDYTFPKSLVKFFLSQCDKIGACSYGVKHYLMEQGIHSSLIEVVPNGVDIHQFDTLPAIVHPARKVACIGRIADWKGQLTLLHAAYILKESHHELPFRFYFFGNPGQKPEEQAYYHHLLHFTKEHHLEGIVQFCGFVPPQTAMQEIDIVVHAAEEAGPFGRVPIEAAAAKRILCVSNIGTPAQIFEHRKTALFFEPSDAKGLAEMLMEAYHNAHGGETLVANAYTLVQEEFSLISTQKKFWNIFL